MRGVRIGARLFVFATCLSLCGMAFGGVENEHLRVYESFDDESADGRYGKGASFSEKKGESARDYRLSPALGKEWTVAFWMRPVEFFGYNGGKGHGLFCLDGESRITAFCDGWGRFQVHDGCGRGFDGNALSFAQRQWSHLACTCDAQGRIRAFVNGNEMPSSSSASTDARRGFVKLTVGGDAPGGGNALGGTLDELKVFDKALSAAEVKEIMETVPGRRTAAVDLYLPCDGEIFGRGVGRFSSAALAFPRGHSQEGLEMVRYGYDRRSFLQIHELPVGRESQSVFLWFSPNWSGEEDHGVHGLLATCGKDFSWSLGVEGDMLSYRIVSGGKTSSVQMPAGVFARKRWYRVAAGYDFASSRMYVAVGDVVQTGTLDVPPPERMETATMIVGDVKGSGTYDKTQAEGTLDEILVVRECLDPAALADCVGTEIHKKLKREVDVVENAAVTGDESRLWDLNGAECRATATRRRIALNALWRFQLTDDSRPFDPKDWIYLPVPGRWSGQENGGADSEFYFRDRSFAVIGNRLYAGREPHEFTNGWFERGFKADPAWRGHEVVLSIAELSPSQTGEVFVNGRIFGRIAKGLGFEKVISERELDFSGWNFVTLHVSDDGGRWFWRGVLGDVALEVRNRIHSQDAEIVTSVKKGSLSVSANVVNGTPDAAMVVLEAEVSGHGLSRKVASSERMVAAGASSRFEVSDFVPDIQLWDVDSPALYSCTVRVRGANGESLDEAEPVVFGCREFEVRGRDFFLNGKKMHLFIHDSWPNSTEADDVRRSARQLKKLGYNAVRMSFDGREQRLETIIRICDEEGILHLANAMGVSGREYVLWSNPDVRAELDERMRQAIFRWRNHASVVCWYLSVNCLGYPWDYHPLKVADGYVPKYGSFPERLKTYLNGVDILRKYDASARPYFFQSGGNHGEIHTSNAYFCWWPQIERDAWPAEWAKRGEKPLVPIETSFPYWASFFGMDFLTPGEPPLFYFENLARYYGPSAYTGESEMQAQVERSCLGQVATLWRDAPGLQRLKSDLLVETARCWRGFDLSGMCPFSELNYAFGTQAPRHTLYTCKTVRLPERDFRRFGRTPDVAKVPYEVDVDWTNALPFATALTKALAPVAAFFDGGACEPVDQQSNYRGGERLAKRLVILNDLRHEIEFRGRWSLGEASGSFVERIAPGGRSFVPVDVTLPKVPTRRHMALEAKIEGLTSVLVDPLDIVVEPPPTTDGISAFALYDDVGKTERKFGELGVPCRKVCKSDNLRERLLVVGTESLDDGFFDFAAVAQVGERVNAGTLRVLVMSQKPEALARLGLRTTPVYARTAFDSKGRVVGPWAGRSTLAPNKPEPGPDVEQSFPVQFYHWNNQNIVASYPILRPSEGAWRAMLSCGMDLVYSPLMEIASGKGTVTFCQLEIESRTHADVQADKMLTLLLRQASQPYSARTNSVVFAGPDCAGEFGLTTFQTNVVRLVREEAGAGSLSTLTDRDFYLRHPIAATGFAGPGVRPLLSGGVVAEKTVDGKRIVFLGFPPEPCKAERKRCKESGLGASVLWSAEILENRLRQIRSVLEFEAAVESSCELADRLSHPVEKASAEMYPYGFNRSTYHTETHRCW